MIGKKTITAVVVTYNRLQLLKRTIDCLRNQTVKLDNVIVVNNGATDGTHDWLDSQIDLQVIHQANVGGSGGFYTGIMTAHSAAYDYVWCMDDDVFPKKDCLEKMLSFDDDSIGIFCPKRLVNGKPFFSEVISLNLTNPFKHLHKLKVSERIPENDAPCDIVGMVFEGPLIKKCVIDKIGYPNKELFILYDDTDYSYRAALAGYRVLYIPTALLDKHDFKGNKTRVEQVRNNKWKLMYHLRNTAYFCKQYGKNPIFRLFGSFQLYNHMFWAILFNLPRNNKYSLSDLKMLVDMYNKGVKGKLGKM